MERSELIPFLETLKGKSVILKNSGYMACQTEVEKFDFYIKYDILMMEDNKSDNYMVLNLDRIKQIQKEENSVQVIVYIDDEIETEVAIELK